MVPEWVGRYPLPLLMEVKSRELRLTDLAGCVRFCVCEDGDNFVVTKIRCFMGGPSVDRLLEILLLAAVIFGGEARECISLSFEQLSVQICNFTIVIFGGRHL